jgi:hypothetical protein
MDSDGMINMPSFMMIRTCDPASGKLSVRDLSPECQRKLFLTAGHSCAQQYRARRHFPQESNEWNIVMLKFQTHLYAVN